MFKKKNIMKKITLAVMAGMMMLGTVPSMAVARNENMYDSKPSSTIVTTYEEFYYILYDYIKEHNLDRNNIEIEIFDDMIIITSFDIEMTYSDNEFGLINEFLRLPPTSIATNGRWDFNGVATISPRYSDRYITGFTRFSGRVYNRGSNSFTAEVLRFATIFGTPSLRTVTVPPRGSVSILNMNISSSDRVFMRFNPIADFHGFFQGSN